MGAIFLGDPVNFSDKNELLEYLDENEIPGLDSEFSFKSKLLVKKHKALGLDMTRWWVMTSVDWVCPCCKRTKEEIVRLNKHNFLSARLDEHHDHMTDFVEKEFTKISESLDKVVTDTMAERFVKRTAFALSAYDPTVICSDCNSADPDAKRLLHLPPEFSFSTDEIANFIIVKANTKHQIDRGKVIDTWNQCKPMFEARKKMVVEIAYLAATNAHWYQPSLKTSKYIERCAEIKIEQLGISKLGIYPYEQALYSPNKFAGNTNSWRLNRKVLVESPPSDSQLAHLNAIRGNDWKKADDDWQCEGCNRSKFQCVRRNNKKEWSFNYSRAKDMYNIHSGSSRHPVCNDCGDALKHLGTEVKEITKLDYLKGSLVVTIDELSNIVKSNPHSRHAIDNEFVENLMPTMLERCEKI